MPAIDRMLAVATTLVVAGAATAAPTRDGDPDPSWGDRGVAILPVPAGRSIGRYGTDAALLPDGRLVVAATVTDLTGIPQTDFGVVRLTRTGQLDTSFGDAGYAIVDFARSPSQAGDYTSGIAVQPDGKILVSGWATNLNADADFAILRLTAGGAPDPSFGNGGKVLVPFNLDASNRDDYGYHVALQADGKILVAGGASTAGGSMAAVVRLLPGGQRDTGFDDDGRVTFDFHADESGVTRVRQLADGEHLLAVGAATTSGSIDFAIARLNANGSLDASFAGGGMTTYAFDIGGDRSDLAQDFVELPDGRLLVCGAVQVNAPFNYDFACMRFLADGQPDASFTRVLLPVDAGDPYADIPETIRRDAQGRILLGGRCSVTDANDDFCLARLLADGRPDPSFGRDGVMTYRSEPGGIGDRGSNGAGGLVVQPDGRIILAGYVRDTDPDTPGRIEAIRVIGDVLFADGFD